MKFYGYILLWCPIFIQGCTRNQSSISKEDQQEYHYLNEPEELNVFLTQAAKYLNMRHEDYGIVDMNDDSLKTVYEMYTIKNKSPYIAHKVIYKADSLSALYKTKQGELSGYVYIFDLNNRLYKVKKYEDFAGRLLDQWVTFDTSGQVNNDSRFMLSSDTLIPGENKLSVYVYTKHIEQVDSLSFSFITEKDTFYVLKTKTSQSQVLLSVPPLLFKSNNIVLEVNYIAHRTEKDGIRYCKWPIHKRLYVKVKKQTR